MPTKPLQATSTEKTFSSPAMLFGVSWKLILKIFTITGLAQNIVPGHSKFYDVDSTKWGEPKNVVQSVVGCGDLWCESESLSQVSSATPSFTRPDQFKMEVMKNLLQNMLKSLQWDVGQNDSPAEMQVL